MLKRGFGIFQQILQYVNGTERLGSSMNTAESIEDVAKKYPQNRQGCSGM